MDITPKEKAKDLILKYYYSLPNNGSMEGINSTTRRMQEAKQCASLAVDELIEESYFTYGYYDRSDYWQEVQQKINQYNN